MNIYGYMTSYDISESLVKWSLANALEVETWAETYLSISLRLMASC